MTEAPSSFPTPPPVPDLERQPVKEPLREGDANSSAVAPRAAPAILPGPLEIKHPALRRKAFQPAARLRIDARFRWVLFAAWTLFLVSMFLPSVQIHPGGDPGYVAAWTALEYSVVDGPFMVGWACRLATALNLLLLAGAAFYFFESPEGSVRSTVRFLDLVMLLAAILVWTVPLMLLCQVTTGTILWGFYVWAAAHTLPGLRMFFPHHGERPKPAADWPEEQPGGWDQGR
ncbi:MAG: hypothetical protein ACREJ2_09600 [Planctomycetota bacterium]